MTAPSPSLPCVPDLVAAEGRTPVNHSKHACSCQLSAQVRPAPSGAHTREGKVWLQPALPSLPHCFSAALSDQAGEMSVPGHSHGTCCPGNGITLLVTVSPPHTGPGCCCWAGAALPTASTGLVVAGLCRLPRCHVDTLPVLGPVSQLCAFTGVSVPSLYLRAASVLPRQGAGVPPPGTDS